MRFLFKWLDSRLRATRHEVEMNMLSSPEPYPSRSIHSNSMNFSIYRASGGYVIETRFHTNDDTQTKRHGSEPEYSLHIITDDKDLGQEISRIITFEKLKY